MEAYRSMYGPLARMVQQQAQYMVNQLHYRDLIALWDHSATTPPSELSFNGYIAFTNRIKAYYRLMGMHRKINRHVPKL